jgi:hypothetical protein
MTLLRKTAIATGIMTGLVLLASALAPFAVAFNLAHLANIVGRPVAMARTPPASVRGGAPFFCVVGPWGQVCNNHKLPQ